jgi:hypothetical protein
MFLGKWYVLAPLPLKKNSADAHANNEDYTILLLKLLLNFDFFVLLGEILPSTSVTRPQCGEKKMKKKILKKN